VIAGRPELADVIRVIGSIQHDRLLAARQSREAARRALGLRESDVAVLVVTTWGPDSVLGVFGEDLLREAARLSERFKFIFVLHPREYRLNVGGGPGWGLRLRERAYKQFLIRDPSESWIPYLVSADLVISDHTSLVQSAVLLRKPILVCPVREGLVMKGSVTDRLFHFAPVLRDAAFLEASLGEASSSYPTDELHALSAAMHSYPGEALSRAKGEIYSLLRQD
jgi:hypothetical protein